MTTDDDLSRRALLATFGLAVLAPTGAAATGFGFGTPSAKYGPSWRPGDGPACSIDVLHDGGLILEAFPWDARAARFDGSPATLRLQIQGNVILRVGKPRLIERPAQARGGIVTEVRGRWRRTTTNWFRRARVFHLNGPGGVLEMEARVRPVQGLGLPAGRYRARVGVLCAP